MCTGGLVDENAHRALQSSKVAGAALDVFENELLEIALAEARSGDRHASPGSFDPEAQVNVAVQVAEEIIHFLNDEPLHMRKCSLTASGCFIRSYTVYPADEDHGQLLYAGIRRQG